MRFSAYVYAGEHERFAPDVRLPVPGQSMRVNLPDGTAADGRLVSVERIDDQQLRVTVDVEDGSPKGSQTLE